MADGEPNVTGPNLDGSRSRLHLRGVSERAADNPGVENPAYYGVGAELKAARERIGATRTEFASRLRIREPYLGAIEEGRFADLPGPVYAVGFIRSYADSMGLDGDDFVYRFKEETATRPDQTELRFAEPEAESRLPSTRLLAVSLLLVAAVYGGWYVLSNTDRSVVERVSPVPERLLASDTAPAQTEDPKPATVLGAVENDSGLSRANATPAAATLIQTESETAAAVDNAAPTNPPATQVEATGANAIVGADESVASLATNDASASATAESTSRAATVEAARNPLARAAAPTEMVDADIEQPPTAPPTEVAVLSVAGPQRVRGADDGSVVPRVDGGGGESRVTLTARLDSWVQVVGEDNELLLTRILRAGDTYFVPNRPGLTLVTGNAGALEVAVDGRALPPIGPVGAVRRNVSLDPEHLLSTLR